MIQDILANIFLSFNKNFIVMPLIGIGYWSYRRDLFSNLLILVLLSMIVNTFLKCVFQVPLKPHLNQHGWYAFPSGHMQLSTVLYGCLWWEFRRTKWAQVFFILLAGMGWAMIWKNYHDFIDVSAGFIVGALLVWGYIVFVNFSLIRRHSEKIGFFLLPLTAILIFFMPYIPQHMSHVWNSQGGLLGFSLGRILLTLTPSHFISTSLRTSIVKSFLGLSVFSGLWFFNQILFGHLRYPLYPFLSFFICGIWLSMGPDFLLRWLQRMYHLSIKKG